MAAQRENRSICGNRICTVNCNSMDGGERGFLIFRNQINHNEPEEIQNKQKEQVPIEGEMFQFNWADLMWISSTRPLRIWRDGLGLPISLFLCTTTFFQMAREYIHILVDLFANRDFDEEVD